MTTAVNEDIRKASRLDGLTKATAGALDQLAELGNPLPARVIYSYDMPGTWPEADRRAFVEDFARLNGCTLHEGRFDWWTCAAFNRAGSTDVHVIVRAFRDQPPLDAS